MKFYTSLHQAFVRDQSNKGVFQINKGHHLRAVELLIQTQTKDNFPSQEPKIK
jgi:hypothetical protein